MTDQQITTLARDYAEEYYKDSLQFFPRPLPDSMEVLVQREQEKASELLCWLSQRYCLVEKSKIQDEWQRANTHVKEAIKRKNSLSESCGKGKRIILKSLFHEIAKEVVG